jgi:hypothetical protein
MTPRRRPLPRTARAVGLAACLVAALAGAPRPLGLELAVARAEEAWLTEFADVCSRTQDAMSLGTDELRRLVERCDKLKPLVDRLDGPQRKVYLKRLQTCRDLYQFMLDSRAAEPAK